MPRPKEIEFDLDDVDADGITVAETLGAAGNFTIGGALTSGGTFTADIARQLICTAVGNESARTFTVTGTDADGVAQTEAITGPNATTTESTKYFKTVTSIASDAATAGDVSFGTVDEAMTQTIPLNFYQNETAALHIDVTGTINYDIQQTFQDVLATSSPAVNNVWAAIAAGGTSDLASSATAGATGVRVIINSYTNGAEFKFRVIQGRR